MHKVSGKLQDLHSVICCISFIQTMVDNTHSHCRRRKGKYFPYGPIHAQSTQTLSAICQCSRESVCGIPAGVTLGIVVRVPNNKLQNVCISYSQPTSNLLENFLIHVLSRTKEEEKTLNKCEQAI